MPPLVWLILLIGARMLPVAVLVPAAFATRSSWRWSMGTIVILSAVIVPVHVNVVVASRLEPSAIAFVSELLVGLALALGFTVLLSALQLSATALTSMAGLSNYNAGGATDGPPAWQRFFSMLAFTLFMVSGGDRHFVEALLDSFQRMPVGLALPPSVGIEAVGGALIDSFCVGIQAAAPIAFCLIAASACVALLGRNGPVLGSFGLGIAVNSILLLVVTWASLGAVATVYQDRWTDGVERFIEQMHPPPTRHSEAVHG